MYHRCHTIVSYNLKHEGFENVNESDCMFVDTPVLHHSLQCLASCINVKFSDWLYKKTEDTSTILTRKHFFDVDGNNSFTTNAPLTLPITLTGETLRELSGEANGMDYENGDTVDCRIRFCSKGRHRLSIWRKGVLYLIEIVVSEIGDDQAKLPHQVQMAIKFARYTRETALNIGNPDMTTTLGPRQFASIGLRGNSANSFADISIRLPEDRKDEIANLEKERAKIESA